MADRIAGQSTLLETRLKTVNSALTRNAAMGKAVGMTFNTLGIAAAAATAIGLKGAIDLQQAMNGIKVATGASSDEMKKLRNIALEMSQVTGQSWAGASTSLATFIQGGIPYKQLIADPAFAVRAAQFMDVMAYRKVDPIPYSESAALVTRVAHQLNSYSAQQIGPVLDALAATSYQMSDSIATAATQLKYFAPAAMGVGVNQSELVSMIAVLGRFGMMTGRGGTGLRSFIQRQYDPRSKPATRAMEELGLFGPHGARFVDARGNFELIASMQHLAQLYQGWSSKYGTATAREMFMRDTGAAFTTTGSAIAQMVMRPGFLEQFSQVSTNIASFLARGGVAGAQSTTMSGLAGQSIIAWTNFQSAATELMVQYLPPLTVAMRFLAEKTGMLTDYLRDHERAAKVAGGGLLGLGALGLASIIGHGVGWLRAGLSFYKTPHMYLGGFGTSGQLGGEASAGLKILTSVGARIFWIAAIFFTIEESMHRVALNARNIGSAAAVGVFNMIRTIRAALPVILIDIGKFGVRFGALLQLAVQHPMQALQIVLHSVGSAASALWNGLKSLGNGLYSVLTVIDKFARRFLALSIPDILSGVAGGFANEWKYLNRSHLGDAARGALHNKPTANVHISSGVTGANVLKYIARPQVTGAYRAPQINHHTHVTVNT